MKLLAQRQGPCLGIMFLQGLGFLVLRSIDLWMDLSILTSPLTGIPTNLMPHLHMDRSLGPLGLVFVPPKLSRYYRHKICKFKVHNVMIL